LERDLREVEHVSFIGVQLVRGLYNTNTRNTTPNRIVFRLLEIDGSAASGLSEVRDRAHGSDGDQNRWVKSGQHASYWDRQRKFDDLELQYQYI